MRPPPRLFLDSCVLIEGLVAPWSAARGIMILARAAVFAFVLADIVIEETERALARKLGGGYGGAATLRADFRLLLRRLRAERVPHATRAEFEEARQWIGHFNDVPVLAAALKARPDWLLTDNTTHFDSRVAARTELRIVTPAEFLRQCGRIFGP